MIISIHLTYEELEALKEKTTARQKRYRKLTRAYNRKDHEMMNALITITGRMLNMKGVK